MSWESTPDQDHNQREQPRSLLDLALLSEEANTNDTRLETVPVEAAASRIVLLQPDHQEGHSRWSVDTKESSALTQESDSELSWTSASPDLGDLTSLDPHPDFLSATCCSLDTQYQTTQPLRMSAASSRRSEMSQCDLRSTASPARSMTPPSAHHPTAEELAANMSSMTKKTRRPSLSQSMFRSLAGHSSSSLRASGDRIPTPEQVPPVPQRPSKISPGPSTAVRYELPPSNAATEHQQQQQQQQQQDAEHAHGNGRRSSLFQLLRRSFSRSSSASRKSSNSSTRSNGTIRKGSGSSISSRRKDSGQFVSQSLRKLSRDSTTPAASRTDHKASAHTALAKARNRHGDSPRSTPPPSVYKSQQGPAAQEEIFHTPTSTVKSPSMPSLQVHHIEDLDRRSLSSFDSDSVYDLYADDASETDEAAEVRTAPPTIYTQDHTALSLAGSETSSDTHSNHSTEGDEEEGAGGTPLWSGFGAQYSSSFINPWSAGPSAPLSPESSLLMSPGGRRSSSVSVASSKRSALLNRAARSSLSLDSAQDPWDEQRPPKASDEPEGRGRRDSLAAARRASLAAKIAANSDAQGRAKALRALSGLDHPYTPSWTASPSSTGSIREKKNRTTAYLDGSLLRPSTAPESVSSRSSSSSYASPRKPSLVLPGDPRLYQRRKSSLSVTFAEHSDDGNPTKPPMPIEGMAVRLRSSQPSTYTSALNSGHSDAGSIRSVSTAESGDDESETSTPEAAFGAGASDEPFFELRNPWTGYSMKQPHANPPSGAAPAVVSLSPCISPFEHSSRRPTLMPSTPKSAKSSLSSPSSPKGYFTAEGQRKPSIGGTKVAPSGGGGMRVSLDLGSTK